ncbi:MAG: hypothetical protein UX78_C0001G0002 [Candidatus Amesbacteria bacterium GW2011_GWA2_47_11]|uniref:Uncharacterized protein n=1 Tax=Candidatus Amesbacteria bacterium GW2011_GWA2_47_11 TaxID=1618357 RepID=A0A0G1RI14_9BACT|nr:MAG: hypothetical protein UX78_C0001G0002 [Candidatus Amesbacteria bacterium GW2011_GWA2_47_11]
MKKILLVMLIFITAVFLLAFLPIGMGTTGLRPKTHGCIGIIIPAKFVYRIFPEAGIELPPFSYYVDGVNSSNRENKYCLGKDIWYGE